MTDLAKLREAIANGKKISSSPDPFPNPQPVVPKDSWHFDIESAKKHLPTNTVTVNVDGGNGYAFGITVKDTVFHAAIVYSGGWRIYCTKPDLSSLPTKTTEEMHKFHYLGGGRLCIPMDNLANCYANFVEWASCYVHYKNTGEDKGFRYFDKR